MFSPKSDSFRLLLPIPHSTARRVERCSILSNFRQAARVRATPRAPLVSSSSFLFARQERSYLIEGIEYFRDVITEPAIVYSPAGALVDPLIFRYMLPEKASSHVCLYICVYIQAFLDVHV